MLEIARFDFDRNFVDGFGFAVTPIAVKGNFALPVVPRSGLALPTGNPVAHNQPAIWGWRAVRIATCFVFGPAAGLRSQKINAFDFRHPGER